MEDLLKPNDVARMLGVSRTWLYDAAKTGRIPSVRIGGPDGPVRFVREDLEAWLDAARPSISGRKSAGRPEVASERETIIA